MDVSEDKEQAEMINLGKLKFLPVFCVLFCKYSEQLKSYFWQSSFGYRV